MNRSIERVHRWINSAPGIFCENHQNDWEQFIQSATYVHNISPIPGSKELSPFFLLFGRDALSPDTISLQQPKENVSADLFASHLLHRLKSACTEYEQINPILDGVRLHPILEGGKKPPPPQLTLPFSV